MCFYLRVHIFYFTGSQTVVFAQTLPCRHGRQRSAALHTGHWLRFLSDLLYPEDIPTVQEFIGYCLIPSNKGQGMMVIKGNGGEGKSQIGVVLSRLFGCNMKDGSIGKISENRFARADLEHTLLCVDDDMRMEALRQTNYVKSIVTAQGQMDLERKGKQSYQGWMYARLLAFSNGDLQALYDRSDGFYRRQLILTTKDKPLSRVDDPDVAEKMAAEVEGILLWAFEGLQRLLTKWYHLWRAEHPEFEQIVFHGLRHSSATYQLLQSDGDFKSVQGNTGHATAAVLMDTYAHTQDKPRLELTEKIEANFYSQDLTPAVPQPRQNEKPAATKISGKEILEAIRLMDADERRELTRALFA